MPGRWMRTRLEIRCRTTACEIHVPRGGVVYCVAGVENQAICQQCARRRFGFEAPDLPELPAPPVMRAAEPPQRMLRLSDAIELPAPTKVQDWLDAHTGRLDQSKRKAQRTLRDANATDGRLKQLGGDA